ncbi:CAP domain-containing protein [Phosphitispora sp. TUW77]|uniref:CAP domain-containing protein n=1 Tax=Phosphitispora sp. TUW77 TaxID=3152361 RepID=UPI003AB22EA1
MKLKRILSLIVVTMFLSATLVTPVQAATYYFPSFQSVWSLIYKIRASQTVQPAPQPAPEPAPQPAPEPTPEPAPQPTPEPTPQPTPEPTPGYQMSAYQKRVVELVNIERKKGGLHPLIADTLLMKGAAAKSQDMVENRYFSHTSPVYGSPFNMMKTFGITYRYAGENIASGQTSPEAVVRAWMNSSGHRANIMSSKFNKIGVGYAYTTAGSYHHFWTQWFTN